MTKIIEIIDCRGCNWFNGGDSKCEHSAFPDSRELEHTPCIPDWCPLEEQSVQPKEQPKEKETFEAKIERVWQICESNGELENLIDDYKAFMLFEELMESEKVKLKNIIEEIKLNQEFNSY